MTILTFFCIQLLSHFGNTPPVIEAKSQYQTYTDSLLTIPIAVSDPDGDAVQIRMEGLPQWLDYHQSGQTITGIPTEKEEGRHKILLVAHDGQAQSEKEIEVRVKLSLQKTLENKLDSLFNTITPGLTGVSAAIIGPDKQLAKTALGKRNRWGFDPAHTDLQDRIASITKTFTAVLTLKLAEEGLLSLDDPISKYLDIKGIGNGQKITVFHLLSHTSGMVDHLNRKDFYTGNWQFKNWKAKDLLYYLSRRKSLFPPGTGYAYSNTAYHLMGEILETATGKTLGKAFEEWIFEPLELKNTFYDDFSSSRLQIENLAQNSRSYEYHLSAAGAAGAIVSTPEDVVRFGNMLYAGKFLNAESMAVMLKDYGTPLGGEEIGLGTRMWEDFGIYHYGHTGSLMDYRSVLMYIPEKKICIALSTNQVHRKWYDLVNNLLKEIYLYYQ